MFSTDDAVSPYLLRPLRSYQEAMRDRAERIPCQGGGHGAGGTDSGEPTRRLETENAEHPR